MSTSAHAVILAAGAGNRLGMKGVPKALLRFGSKSLLSRHIESLRRIGVTRIDIVVGYEATAIFQALVGECGAIAVRVIPVLWQEKGSLFSLVAANIGSLDADTVLLMDADVLYHGAIIERLVSSRSQNAVLVDRNGAVGSEPVKLCVRGNTIVDFEKRPTDLGDWYGESVGFFKLGPTARHELGAIGSQLLSARGDRLEYEAALKPVLLNASHKFAPEDITGLPWIEIDFEDDLRRAETHVFPFLEETLSGNASLDGGDNDNES
ncbi:NTP transferase domain-containing protein [Bradyrhizobium neotropicale]|uniref:MobA-like NTP transferase domain-containing protein n=1 Tax=Bradyrhizobium neotropicale TaxID=1497615 RepID=A0A176Z925_9BRAD|nr:phosphocholine cytidylyltransferase family protein [Bradyrhizobium neotropicale]OAF16917.1 hypothetical protein AXW67_00125 [Bradyrhizobium neotropicale]